MKSKKSILIAIIFIVVGLGVTTYAYFDSGWSTFNFNTKYGNVGLGSFEMNNHHEYSNSNSTTLDSFKSLNIDLNYADLKIEKSDSQDFKIDINYKNENSKVTHEIRNGTLFISDNYFKKANYRNNRNEIIVYIPTEAIITNLKSYSDYGETKINYLNAEKIEIENNMGSIKIENSIFTNSDIDLDMGEFIANNTIFTNLNLECSMGSAEIDGQILGNNELSMDMGSLNLNLNQLKDDTKIKAESDLGSIIIDGTKSTGFSSEQIINPHGTNTIELETNMGSVEINFIQ